MPGMYERIVKDINQRISAQPHSMAATDDEVRICWLVSEIESLRKQLSSKCQNSTCILHKKDSIPVA